MKKVLSLFLSAVMLLSITAGLDFSAYATVGTGSCGDNVFYTFDDETGILTIGGKGDMEPLVSYLGSSFIKYDKVTEVRITSTVTSICHHAFNHVTHGSAGSTWYYGFKMTSATIGSGVKSIDNSAFSSCDKLTEIVIPDACNTIGNEVFISCSSLENVHLGNGLKSLGSRTFKGDKKLININFPNNLESMGSECFMGCSSIEGDIVLQNKLSYIGTSAFSGCDSINSITIHNSDCKIAQSNTTILNFS